MLTKPLITYKYRYNELLTIIKHNMLNPTTFKAQMTAWMRYNSFRKLKTLNVPTLIINGKEVLFRLETVN